jgi:hypothetical protein
MAGSPSVPVLQRPFDRGPYRCSVSARCQNEAWLFVHAVAFPGGSTVSPSRQRYCTQSSPYLSIFISSGKISMKNCHFPLKNTDNIIFLWSWDARSTTGHHPMSQPILSVRERNKATKTRHLSTGNGILPIHAQQKYAASLQRIMHVSLCDRPSTCVRPNVIGSISVPRRRTNNAHRHGRDL